MSFINPYAFDTNDLIGPNTTLNLSFDLTKSMLVEGDLPVTEVASDGDSVGCVYDQTINGLILRQGTSANRPVYGSDGTRNNFLTFDGTNDSLPILTSLSFFNTLWQAVPKGSILMWFKMNGGDNVSQFIFNNTDIAVAGNDAGFQIIRGSTNLLAARATSDFSGAGLKWTYATTATVTVASGWRGMIVSVNGTGASAGRFILMDSAGTILEDNTFSVTAGATVNAQTNAVIGIRANANDFPFNGSISSIIVENFPVTDKLIDQFKNHNPPRNTTSEFTPLLQYLMDMNNSAFIFSDAAGSIPATNGDTVRVIRSSVIGNFNLIGGAGSLRRIWASASAGTSAIYRTNQINGHATIEFDGTDDNYTMTAVSGTFFEELAGKNTLFIVMKNDDAVFGSHPFSGNNYITLTGSTYRAPGLSPDSVIHPDPAGTQTGQICENTGVDDYKIIAYRRNGSTLNAWNADKLKATDTSSSRLSFTNMGVAHPSLAPDWNMDGHIAYVAKYNGVMTDAEVEAEIDRLKARFGL